MTSQASLNYPLVSGCRENHALQMRCDEMCGAKAYVPPADHKTLEISLRNLGQSFLLRISPRPRRGPLRAGATESARVRQMSRPQIIKPYRLGCAISASLFFLASARDNGGGRICTAQIL